jgi:hypothetical protein
MAVPHAYDPPGGTSWSPDEHNQSRIEPVDRGESGLSVIKAIVYPGEVEAGEDLFGPAHIQAPLLQRPLPLLGIAGDAHRITVATLMRRVKPGHRTSTHVG